MGLFDSPEKRTLLATPSYQRALKTYQHAENKRIYMAVYAPLAQERPPLLPFLTVLKRSDDPVKELEQASAFVRDLKLLKNILSDPQSPFSPTRLLESIERFSSLYSEITPCKETYYLKLARTLCTLSSRIPEPLEELVQDFPFIDDVTREVFSRGDSAKSYQISSADLTQEFYSILSLIREDSPNKESHIIPPLEDLEMIKNLTLEYQFKELERIYSSRR